MSDITLVLDAINRGENQASEKLLPLVYNELRHLAAARMLQESAGHTLQPTASGRLFGMSSPPIFSTLVSTAGG